MLTLERNLSFGAIDLKPLRLSLKSHLHHNDIAEENKQGGMFLGPSFIKCQASCSGPMESGINGARQIFHLFPKA